MKERQCIQLTADEARQGVTGDNSIIVLSVSMGLSVISFLIVAIVL
jgi:hypothetical protein